MEERCCCGSAHTNTQIQPDIGSALVTKVFRSSAHRFGLELGQTCRSGTLILDTFMLKTQKTNKQKSLNGVWTHGDGALTTLLTM